MKKIVQIEGMSCGHCAARAEKALNSIEGIEAKVNLKKNQAVVNLTKDVDDSVLKNALKEVDLEAVSVKDKKGFFG